MFRQVLRFVVTLLVASLSASTSAARAEGWTVRTARLVMPYGMRTPKHHLWYRDVTRAQREVRKGNVLPRSGPSTRHDPLMILHEHKQTSDRYRDRGYAAFAEYALSPGLALGVSGLITLANADRLSFEQEKTWHKAESVFLRARMSRTLSVHSELELSQTSRRAFGYAVLLQLDYEPFHGLHLLCTGELTQRPTETRELYAQNDVHPGAWMTVDWLITPHFEARLDAITRRESGPQLMARFSTYF
ncbi:MAG: hypothetical protein ABW352_21475 [Polyangiales bacterium]